MSVIPRAMVKRTERCVCKFCGGHLEPAIIVYNRYGGNGLELYCPHCRKNENGVEKELYNWARKFVALSGFDYFTEICNESEKIEKNVAKVCEIISWHLRYRQLLTDNGLEENFAALLQKEE